MKTPSSRVVENPVINSPYEKPVRHFRFDDEGITNEIVEGRRNSAYVTPIPQARAHGGDASQMTLDAGLGIDKVQENRFLAIFSG